MITNFSKYAVESRQQVIIKSSVEYWSGIMLIIESWPLCGFILFISSIIVLAYIYLTRNFSYWEKKGVVNVSPVPLFGNFKDVILQKKTAGHWLAELYKLCESQPYVGLYILDKPFIMIRDLEIIKQILIKDSHIFQDKHVTANPNDILGGANLFLIKNPSWRYLRSKLTPIYTSGKLRKMFELMLEVCSDLDTFLESHNSRADGNVLKIDEITANFTTDLIATTAFGVRANSLNNPDAGFRKHGRKFFKFTPYRGFEFFALFFAPWLASLLNVYFFNKENEQFLRNTFWSIFNQREESEIKRHDLIDLLIELRRNQTEGEKKIFELDRDRLVAQASIFLSGGFDTASKLMTFTLHELAIHPDIQDKVRKEIQAALEKNDGKITYEMVNSALPYLDMVVAETLRMYAPNPFLDRVASQDYKVPGHDLIIEKGTPVLIPVMGLHFDEEYFPNPLSFNPENFTAENKQLRKAGVYIPFGDGPHVCIGQRLGLIQAKIGLVTILSKYEVSPCEKTRIPVKLNPRGIFIAPGETVFLKLRKLVDSSSVQ